ncbi:choloylglycine hydrolase [Chlorella sorokiniana]|uniref:Choloylglycine hydrolase n=1 Tax=Chlorella sorokiniana TaxID=3076 RepID=A0A2P6TZF0_CHLSO|nr:choloylglycine hydrolase [Chlorella sorokiniana]|eukprot:PRW59442.1 choloylglycine hydrolase [Chlorella sorokiniana]
MNSAGLAGGAQTLGDTKGPMLRYRADGPRTVLAWPEVLLYLLGSYASVQEVAEEFTPQTHQVITNYASPALRSGVEYLFRLTDIVPVHLSLYDASGDGALIEFDGEKGWMLYRNVSAVTNMPTYPEQLQNLQRWQAAKANTTRYMSELLRGSYEVVYQQLPGSYSSAARFVRLRELLTQVCGTDDTPYPDDTNWSPAFDGVADMPERGALAQAAGILQSVEVTRGFTFPLAGWTQCASLRDLANRMLYWRTPLTARWQGVNVTAAAAADGPRILPVFEGWQDAWDDVTALLEQVPGLEPGPAEPGELEDLLPVLNGTAADGG